MLAPARTATHLDGQLKLIALAASAAALAILLLHAAVNALLPALSKRGKPMAATERADLVMQIVCLVAYAVPLPVLYARGVLELHSTPELRWQGGSAAVEAAMVLQLGATLYEACIFVWHGKPWLYHLHHVVVVYGYVLGLWVGQMHFWAAWTGMVELGLVNLCVLKIFVISDRGRGSALEAANGVALWLCYLVSRVGSLPIEVVAFAHDATHHADAVWPDGLSFAHQLIRWSTPACAGLLLAISLAWFVQLTKGMLKALGGAKAHAA